MSDLEILKGGNDAEEKKAKPAKLDLLKKINELELRILQLENERGNPTKTSGFKRVDLPIQLGNLED